MRTKAVVMFSGGLDSILAARVLMEQGIEVHLFNLRVDCPPIEETSATAGSSSEVARGLTNSQSVADPEHGRREIRNPQYPNDPPAKGARILGLPLTRLSCPDEFLEMVKHPRYGYGSNMNPCIDCKIQIMKKAREFMEKIGASFVATGEVLGERPMSQRRDTMMLIEKAAGMKRMIVRPLSAKLLDPTIPEETGVVDREKLLDIRGRSRKPQMELAAKFGITEYPSPAGGCQLTDPGFAARLDDLLKDNPNFDCNDFNLLKVGRHFRFFALATEVTENTEIQQTGIQDHPRFSSVDVSSVCSVAKNPSPKAVVGRDDADNQKILAIARTGDILLEVAEFPGPVTLCRGPFTEDLLRKAASLTARYGKARTQPEVEITGSTIPGPGCVGTEQLSFRVPPREYTDLGATRIGERGQ